MSKFKLEDLIIITSNENKLSEINEILGTAHKVSKIKIDEIQSLNLDEVIAAKAKTAFKKIKKPVLVEDVSLEIKALNGLPGTFVKFFLQTLQTEGTASLLKGKDTLTKVTDAVAVYDGNQLKIFKGSVYGNLTFRNRGKNGFGFDKVFIPKGYEKTYAELPNSIKNQISHRAKALKKLKKFLNSQK